MTGFYTIETLIINLFRKIIDISDWSVGGNSSQNNTTYEKTNDKYNGNILDGEIKQKKEDLQSISSITSSPTGFLLHMYMYLHRFVLHWSMTKYFHFDSLIFVCF